MFTKIPKIIFLALIVLSTPNKSVAQCFSCFGNPAGGERILGVLDQNTLLITSYYSFSVYNKYFTGDKKYTGDVFILDRAYYNYLSILAGYGISQNITIETEAGYYLNKSQIYNINSEKLSGYGLSNAVISFKHLLYLDFSNEIEISWGLGAYVPFSTKLQQIDGVTLPLEIQPSLGSYGAVFQSFFLKENSYRSTRYFFANRIEKYIENNQNIIWGTFYENSLYFSKHFFFKQQDT